MADEKQKNGAGFPEEDSNMASDSGLGNLPPLSDFDSQDGGFDSGLPPLGSFDSETNDSDDGGLPPISDIQVETPQPTGGNIKTPPPGFDTTSDTFSSGSSAGTGFQDLAADSDFSPETPDIGPGPGMSADSNMDTPMFDSAFGGGSSGFDSNLQTPAPTQAMETPMFGEGQAPAGGSGFDQGNFAGMDMNMGGGAFDAGTPPPDFSPDTDIQQPVPNGGGPKAKKGNSAVLAIVLLIVGLIGGIAGGPYISGFLPFLPNPMASEMEQLRDKNAKMSQEIRKYENIQKSIDSQGKESGVDKAQLLQELEELTKNLDIAKAQYEEKSGALSKVQDELKIVEDDLSQKNEAFVTAQEQFEELQNETAIIQARQKGLVAEVERLTNYVGQLDDANVRRLATKDALAHNVDRLVIQIKESMPLTPQKYAHSERLAAAEALRDKVADAKWVAPALQNAYTELYLKELEIASCQEYFFARLAVTDEFGNKTKKWAECLMNGNWSVNYRTLDGKNIGIYLNQNSADTPLWDLKEDYPARVKKEIEDSIVASRVEGFEEKVRILAEKELAAQDGTEWQRNFDSL